MERAVIAPAVDTDDPRPRISIDVEHASAPWSMCLTAVALGRAGSDWYDVAKAFRAEVQARQMAAPIALHERISYDASPQLAIPQAARMEGP